MHTINPVAHPGTLCYVVTPLEEDHLVYIALELHLPPYHRIGSISVQPRLSKLRLIAQTGIQIVCFFFFFFFPPFPKAMRGIPPGRCKLHGPGSTWKASQRLQRN